MPIHYNTIKNTQKTLQNNTKNLHTIPAVTYHRLNLHKMKINHRLKLIFYQKNNRLKLHKTTKNQVAPLYTKQIPMQFKTTRIFFFESTNHRQEQQPGSTWQQTTTR